MPCVMGCVDRTYEGGMHKDFPPWPFLYHTWYIIGWAARTRERGDFVQVICGASHGRCSLRLKARRLEFGLRQWWEKLTVHVRRQRSGA